MKMVKISIVLFLTLTFSSYSLAQLKSQLPEKPSVRLGIPAKSSSNLFSPDRFSMQQSYSLSYFSSGNFSGSVGMYLNRMQYLVSDKVTIDGIVGFVHNPFSSISPAPTSFSIDNLIYGANLTYRPFDSMTLHIGFQSLPAIYGMSAYGRNVYPVESNE